MRFVRVSGTAAAILFCAATMPAYAQHEGGEHEKQGGKHEERAAPGRQEHAPQAAHQQERQTGRPQEHAQQVRQPSPARYQQQQQVQQQAQHQQAQQQQQPQQRVQQHVQQPQQHTQQAQQPQHVQQVHNGQQHMQQVRNQQQPQRSREQAQTWQQAKGWQHGGGWQGHDSWQGDRARNWSSDHRSWAQRGGYGGYYVPQASFSLYFGNSHYFRLGGQPTMYMGYPRFEYSGYSFLMVDPYPEYWSENWYNSDDVYIDYDNGYYLHNRNYPGVRLAVTVQL